MSQNLIKRVFTSVVLLSLLFFVNFAHQNIFIVAILILGMIICIEANNLFSKLLFRNNFKKNLIFDIFNSKFLILNIITFCYIFFIFCSVSYEIHRSEGPLFFLYIS
jgi:phosphatidate cytidylyltransferase